MPRIVLRCLCRIAALLPLLPCAAGPGFATQPLAFAGPQAAVTAPPIDAPPRIDRVLVIKHLRRLYLLARGEIVAAYPVKLGHHPLGPKVEAGDGKTPEGDYVLDRRNPLSLFTLALHVSYPNERDRAHARALHVNPGGAIEVHGDPFVASAISAGKLRTAWTAGCIALSNADMKQAWDLVADGTPIEIEP